MHSIYFTGPLNHVSHVLYYSQLPGSLHDPAPHTIVFIPETRVFTIPLQSVIVLARTVKLGIRSTRVGDRRLEGRVGVDSGSRQQQGMTKRAENGRER